MSTEEIDELALSISIAGGDDSAFYPISIQASERFSELTKVVVEFTYESDEGALVPADVIGADAVVKVMMGETEVHGFHGVVASLQQVMDDFQHDNYVVTILPKLWQLTKTTKCAIFSELKTSEIITQVIGDHSVAGDVAVTTQVRPYCVQYNETDFDFLSRLMEEEGLFYHFFSDSSDVKIASGVDAYQDFGETPLARQEAATNAIFSWAEETNYPLEEFRHADYDYTSAEVVEADSPSSKSKYLGKHYEYPGHFVEAESGADWATRRMELSEAGARRIFGQSKIPKFSPGMKFTPDLSELHESATEEEVVVIAVDHNFSAGEYSNSFECIPADVPFRPQRRTPKPRVHGAQVGLVVNGGANDPATDSEGIGRIQVQFPWGEDVAPIWIRVAQPIAGPGWGMWAVPRGGQEVVVAFEDGDPDRPLVVGALYNGVNMPPYTLPDEQTKTGFRSRSTPSGGDADFNELTFDDDAGNEQIYIRGQKDVVIDVVENYTKTLETGNETKEIQEGTLTYTVKSDVTIESESKITLKVGDNSIEITTSGITVKGTEVVVEGTSTADLKAPTVTVDGSGQTNVKGGMVMIN